MSNTSVGAKLWLLWVLANALGGVIGCSIGVNLARAAGPPGGTAGRLVFSITLGIAIGLSQWLVLRQWIRAELWILASAVSWSLGWPEYRRISWTVTAAFLSRIGLSWLFLSVSFVVGGAILGALIGLTQWFVLKNQVSGARVWIRANVVGYIVGLAIIHMVHLGTIGTDLPEEVAGGILMVLLVVISRGITGRTLERLLQQSGRTR